MEREYKLPIDLINAINDEKLAIFIGAGISRHYGCSSWESLAKELITICEYKSIISKYEKELLINDRDYKKLITIAHSLLKNRGYEKDFYKQMRYSLNHFKAKKASKPKIYKDLINLGGVFVTTNADIWINKYFHQDTIIYKDKDFTSSTIINKQHLYKIHGCISDKKSLVFEVDEYLQRYSCHSEFTEFLKKFFNEYTVLFVGYGLGEFEILDYVFKSKETKKRHYFLKDYYKCESTLKNYEQEYFKKLNIEIIPYYKDLNGFGQLPIIFKEWREEIELISYKSTMGNELIDNALENLDE